jgi:hypothetical protein
LARAQGGGAACTERGMGKRGPIRLAGLAQGRRGGGVGFGNGYWAEHRDLLLLIPVVLRELRDFFLGSATGFGFFVGKWRKIILELSGGATGRRNMRRGRGLLSAKFHEGARRGEAKSPLRRTPVISSSFLWPGLGGTLFLRRDRLFASPCLRTNPRAGFHSGVATSEHTLRREPIAQ